jgi:predicted Holliday junction resolvase-like endonuclease
MLKLFGANGWSFIIAVIVFVLGLLGIQTKRINSAKKKVEEQEGVIHNLSQQAENQKKVVQEAEDQKGKIVKQKGDALEEIVPEIGKMQDIPKDEQQPLGDDVKKAAKAQAERIKAKTKAKAKK